MNDKSFTTATEATTEMMEIPVSLFKKYERDFYINQKKIEGITKILQQKKFEKDDIKTQSGGKKFNVSEISNDDLFFFARTLHKNKIVQNMTALYDLM